MRPRLSVIIPTFNEVENIGEILKSLNRVLKKIPHEIIVVDDNSPDQTWRVVQEMSGKNLSVRLIRRYREQGLSSAVLTGMSVAVGDVLAVMDGDMQHDEAILPDLFQAIDKEKFDLVVGSREAEGGSYGEWSKRRRFASKLAARLAKLILPVPINDPMSGFFAISRECYNKTVEKINPRGFKILLEFVGRNGKNLRIKEIGYIFRKRMHGETKLSASVIRNYLVALYEIRFGKLIPATFILYSFVGTTGVVVNLLAFKLGEYLGFPHIKTGISEFLDPLYSAVPFGYQAAILTNYLLNNYITFFEKRHKGLVNFLKGFLLFEIVSLFGLIIHTGVFQLLHINGFLQEMVQEDTRALLNNAFAIIVALVSNYYLNINFTWGRRK